MSRPFRPPPTVAAWLPHSQFPSGGASAASCCWRRSQLSPCRTQAPLPAPTAGRSSRSTGSIPSEASSATRASARPPTATSIEDVPLRHRHLRARRHRVYAIGVGQHRLGAAAARDDRDQDATTAPSSPTGTSSRPSTTASTPSPTGPARPHLQGLGARALRRTRRRPLREPAAARRDHALRGHDAADGARVQLRA